MNAIGLEECHVLAESFEQVRHERRFPGLRDVGEERIEIPRVAGTIVRRNAHPDDEHFRASRLGGSDHRVEIRARRVERLAAQRVVAAQLDHHHAGAMLLQQRGQA